MPISYLILTLALALGDADAADTGSSIQWMKDAEKSMKTAQEGNRAVLFYLFDDEPEQAKLRDTQQAAFIDAVVAGIVRDRYVPVRLPDSTLARNILKTTGAENVEPFTAYVTSGKGKLVGTIAADQLSDPEMLAARLRELSRLFGSNLYGRHKELQSVLENKKSSSAELTDALKLIGKYRIVGADEAVVQLLDRKKLDDAVRAVAYDTLARLSTERSVSRLLEAVAKKESAAAARAMHQCTPAGAEMLMSAADLDKPKRLRAAYEAATAICGVKDTKPGSFWDGPDKDAKLAEIKRAKEQVHDAATRWREARAEPTGQVKEDDPQKVEPGANGDKQD